MKILIIGCGRILYKHLEAIKFLGEKKLKIVGICDINKKKADYYSKILKVPNYKNYFDAIRELNPDLVSILTPSGLHFQHIVSVLKLGKNIIVEKPMCLKIEHAKKIIKLSKKFKKKVFVVMQNKFNVPVVKLFSDIKKNRFGKIFHSSVIVRWKRDNNYYNLDKWRGTWKLDGGVVCNQASHHLDLLRTIMGNPISVIAKGFKHLSKIEVEDTALIIFNFKKNKSAIMEATTAMRPKDIEGSISILGSQGSAKIGGFALNEITYYHSKNKSKIDKFKTKPDNVYGFGHKQFYKHVYYSIIKDKKSNFEALESAKTIYLINAIYKSIETKKEIFLNKNINSKRLGK